MARNNVRTAGQSYVGVRATTPPQLLSADRDPNSFDVNFIRGSFWLNTITRELWRLSGFQRDNALNINTALWVTVGNGSGTVTELTSNTGGAVLPLLGNINTVGDGIGITGVGNPGTHTITFSLIGGGIAAQSFPTGAGVSTVSGTTAVPTALGVLNVLGAHNVDTGGAVANTITVFGTNTITLGDLATVAAGSPAATLTTGDIQLNDKNGAANGEGIAKIRFWPAVTGQDYNDIYFYLNNVFMGQNAGNQTMTPTQAIFNVGIGSSALNALTTGAQNTAIGGTGVLAQCTTGLNNTAIGYQALTALTTGQENTAIGDGALVALQTGDDNVVVGAGSGGNYTGAESDNIILGAAQSGVTGTSGLTIVQANTVRFLHNFPGAAGVNGSNVFLGESAGNFTVTDTNNIGIGNAALLAVDAPHNIGIGTSSLAGVTTGDGNVALGHSTGYSPGAADGITTGSFNVMIGYAAGTDYRSSDSYNIMISADDSGLGSGRAGESGIITIVTKDVGDENIFIGQGAGNDAYTIGTAIMNVALGANTLANLTTGDSNTSIGAGSMPTSSTAEDCVAVGTQAMDLLTTGSNNTALGAGSLRKITTGAENIGIGRQAGFALTSSESSNILIGSVGVIADNNTIRLGGGTGTGTGQQNRCFVSGIRGITTGVNDAIPVLIDSAGQLGTVSSSIRYKKNVQPLGDFSDKIYGLEPVTFQDINDSAEIDRYGLIAEQVHEVLPEMVIYNDLGQCETVRYSDLVPLMLNEIKKLKQRIDELEAQ